MPDPIMSSIQLDRTLPVVVCPGCSKAMSPKAKEPATELLVDVVYICESCGTETKRALSGKAVAD